MGGKSEAMAKPSVVIQALGRFTAYHAGRAAAERGYLRAFVTGRRRKDEAGVPADARRHHRVIAWSSLAGARLPFFGNPRLASRVFDPFFDRRASRQAEPVSVFHGFLAYSLYSLRLYRALGAQIVVDTGAAHIETERDLVLHEYQRWGIRGSAMRPAWVARQVNEYHEADVILVPSTFVADSLKARGIPSERLFFLPYGVDVDRFPFLPPRSQRGKLRVVFVGGITLEKGIGYLLEAIAALTDQVTLTLIGRVFPDAKPAMRRFSGLYRHIPHVPNSRLKDIYAEHDLLVLPSIQDGSGMVVTEAMACGRPVLVTDHVGAKDFLGNGGGIVVRHSSAEALRQGLEGFLVRRSAIAGMGSEARDAVLGWTWQDYGARLCTLYEQLALASAHGEAGTGISEAIVEGSAALLPPLRM